MKLSILKMDGQYWIVGIHPSHGPYDTKAEAEDDMRGIKRWHRYGNEVNVEPEAPPFSHEEK